MAVRAAFKSNGKVWITDGTDAGTYLLEAGGPNTYDLVPFGDRIVFEKSLPDGKGGTVNGLAVSAGVVGQTTYLVPSAAEVDLNTGWRDNDGWPQQVAAAGGGTLVLTLNSNGTLVTTNGAPAGTSVFNPPPPHGYDVWSFADPVSIGTRILFSAPAPDYRGLVFNTLELWAVDAISGAIEPIAPTGEAQHGLYPRDITRIGHRALFWGDDQLGNEGLWVTDGTAAQTYQITPRGLAADPKPQFMFSLGRRAIFLATGADGAQNLWVSDGTTSGTQQITGAGAGPAAQSTSITVNRMPPITFGSKAIFSAMDQNGEYGLWVTDGTAAGTREFLSQTQAFQDFSYDGGQSMWTSRWQWITGIAYHGKVLFSAIDSWSRIDLWVTDGTEAGTHQIIPEGANVQPMVGLAPSDFAMVGDQVVFSGENSAGQPGLWTTDGTAAGTHEVGAGSFTSGNPQDIVSFGAPEPASDITRNELNGDAFSDLIWQYSNGFILEWNMSGYSAIAGSGVAFLDPSWSVMGTGDLTGNGVADILWRNTSGQIYAWNMEGSTIDSILPVQYLDPSWHALAVADFSGIGRSGILWQNDSGLIAEWDMNNNNVESFTARYSLDNSWYFLTASDFTGDGKADVLWQNTNGLIYEWQMDGGSVANLGAVGVLDSSWKFLAAGDFNGDGKADLMWQNASGQINEWNMNGTAVTGSNVLGVLDRQQWDLLAVGDYNGDGQSDLMWRNKASGLVYEWQMNGGSVGDSHAVGTMDGNWKLLA